MDSNNFLRLLSEAIPDDYQEKASILQYAEQIERLPEMIAAYQQINDPIVIRAQRLYLRHNPRRGNTIPSLPVLIRWLRGRRGQEYAEQLEKRLAKIFKYLNSFGKIPPDGEVYVPIDVIVALRILSYIDK